MDRSGTESDIVFAVCDASRGNTSNGRHCDRVFPILWLLDDGALFRSHHDAVLREDLSSSIPSRLFPQLADEREGGDGCDTKHDAKEAPNAQDGDDHVSCKFGICIDAC